MLRCQDIGERALGSNPTLSASLRQGFGWQAMRHVEN